ncbi:pentachlorophenol 4-monooxygenase [Acrasis kona]|uniref:Pentachlorophenol 4-monooxygenase n=1 Tax=Acrasis kona TaxID=1008807 RepID=A0AAW2YU70_9EUKA
MNQTDVLIVGAGPSGLTMAIELARRGISFRIVEKAETYFHGSRGKGIQPRTLEVFEDLGIVDPIKAAGMSFTFMRIHQPDGTFTDTPVFDKKEDCPHTPHPIGTLLPQFQTESILRKKLEELGGRVELDTQLDSLVQEENFITASLTTHSEQIKIQAKYLVAADGGRSTIRKSLGVQFPGASLGVRAFVADVFIKNLSRDAWHRWGQSPMESILICPLFSTNMFQVHAPISMDGEVDLSPQGITDMIKKRTKRDDIVVDEVNWSSVYTMGAHLAEKYQVGRVLLVGDAAHTHPPTGGQGLNTSIQDSYNLAWKLAAVLKGAPQDLISTYERERRPIASDMVNMTIKILEDTKKGLPMRRDRDTQQLDLCYSDDVLTLKSNTVGGHLCGKRAPDATMKTAAGPLVRVHELLKGAHWTLLGYEVSRGQIGNCEGVVVHVVGEQGDLLDEFGHFNSGYGVNSGTWVLVRPDNYVGAVVNADDIDELHLYLRKVGIKMQ